MISGTYEMTSSDNYEEYLKATGVRPATRKIEAASKPTVELTENGDNLKLKTTTTLKTIDLVFTLDKEFVEETTDGRKCNTTVTRDGNTLIQTQKLDGQTFTITRTFRDNGLDATFEANGAVSKRIYKRI
ncbi:lipocalin/fatty-acid binding family protein [Streptomyces sp. NPDC006649]|uniref:lipocalin/fatty-acid binding family protein n=1 Tax=Streptomyces sp. NPDC006649 TaxID=3156896 RepID=UPI0033B863CE